SRRAARRRNTVARLGLARGAGSVLRELLPDLVGLLGLQGERSLPVAHRSGDVALPLGEVPEVLLDRRIVGLAPVGLRQVDLRRFELPEPEVDPTQRIEVGAVSRLAPHRFLEELVRLLEVLSAIGPHVAEVVLRGRVVGPQLQEIPEDFLGVGVAAAPLEARAEAEPGLRALRETLDRASRGPDGA